MMNRRSCPAVLLWEKIGAGRVWPALYGLYRHRIVLLYSTLLAPRCCSEETLSVNIL